MAFDRSKFGGKGLQNAVQRSNETVNDNGGFRNYLKDSIKRPIFRKIPVGTMVFDIVPFIAERDFGTIKAGSVQYVLDVWAHTNVGPTKDTVICPASTLGLPCPICEERNRLESQGMSFDQLKSMRPKRRVVYNIWVHDASRTEENKGVQILEGAHFSFEKNIQAIARHPVTGEYIFFADIDMGKSIAFTRTGSGATDTRYDGFQFVDRRGPLPDAIVEQSVPLESYIEVLPYDVLKAKICPPTERLQEPEDVPTQAPVYGQQAPVYGQQAPVYGQQAPVYGQQAPAYPQTPQAAPAQPTAPQAAPRPASAPRRSAPVASNNQCPMADIGGVFGASLDKLQQCAACAVWDDCAVEHDRQATSGPQIDDIPF